MSRWRRRDPAGPDPEPTERMVPPERSWQAPDRPDRPDRAPEPGDGPDPDRTASIDAADVGTDTGTDTRTDTVAGLYTEEPTDLLDIAAAPWHAGEPTARLAAADDDRSGEPDNWFTELAGPSTEGRSGPWSDPSVPSGDSPDDTDDTDTGDPDPHGTGDPDEPAPGTDRGTVDAQARSLQRANAREEILGRVRAAVGGRPAPEEDVPRRYRRSLGLGREETVSLFAERVADYTATVWSIMPEQLAATIAVRLVERGIRRIVVSADMPASWLPQYVDVRVDHGDLTGRDLDAVDGVITGSALGIAETGTIVLDGGRLQGRRLLSLVPDYHLCVVDAADVVGNLPEALGRLDPARPLTFVSGPSATSDIELDRVEGVHGPRILDVLLLV
ncbi:MAG TPA: LUD domain-containing protein [Mycobacteriales bacterium]|nr:LUD domain-containing protein [Mycobacteriales bacterium]